MKLRHFAAAATMAALAIAGPATSQNAARAYTKTDDPYELAMPFNEFCFAIQTVIRWRRASMRAARPRPT